MEAIGVGASVLAFLTLGLSSTKVVYELISSIKDGGMHVKQIKGEIQGLQLTLERLSRCRHIAELRDEALAARIKACDDDMKVYATKLRELAVSGTESRLGKQWKKVKIALSDKDLTRMSAVVVGHTTALSLYLNATER